MIIVWAPAATFGAVPPQESIYVDPVASTTLSPETLLFDPEKVRGLPAHPTKKNDITKQVE
jgi:hypothetical protein